MIRSLTISDICIHQITIMQCDFAESIAVLARHGVFETALWHEKLDDIGIATAKQILTTHDIHAVSVCAGGLFTSRDRRRVDAALDRTRRLIDAAQAFDALSVVIITGGLDDGDQDLEAARERSVDCLAELVPYARAAGIRLALEPLHPMVCGFRSVISTLRDAMAFIERLDADDVVALALDSYALWWDANLESDIENWGSRVINFHVSDWLNNTQDVRVDRGMPGDGLINNRKIRGWLEATGYHGAVEVEILSARNWWKQDPNHVVQCVLDRYQSHL